MKRVLLILAILLMLPNTVMAYKIYTPGEEVNFYLSEDEEGGSGTTTVALEDMGSESRYVRVWAIGASYSGNSPYKEPALGHMGTSLNDSGIYEGFVSYINEMYGGFTYARPISEPGNLDLISLNDLVTVFNALSNDGGETYTIDLDKWGDIFDLLPFVLDAGGNMKKGYYTSSYVSDEDKIWVLEVDKDATTKETKSAIIKKVSPETNEYVAIPVIYADKEYDCQYKGSSISDEYSCYKCGEEYKWSIVGSQDAMCELAPEKTSKATCVANPKTGRREDALVFIAIAGLSAMALLMVKRKEIFKKI